jgi:hypothetical protein
LGDNSPADESIVHAIAEIASQPRSLPSPPGVAGAEHAPDANRAGCRAAIAATGVLRRASRRPGADGALRAEHASRACRALAVSPQLRGFSSAHAVPPRTPHGHLPAPCCVGGTRDARLSIAHARRRAVRARRICRRQCCE